MGSTAMRAADLRGEDFATFLWRQFEWESETGRRRVLAARLLPNGHFWAAVEHIKPDGARFVWAGHALTGRFVEDGCTWISWKMMTEHEGPSADDCPAGVFGLLTDFDANPSYGPAWRARVADRLNAPLPGAQLALL